MPAVTRIGDLGVGVCPHHSHPQNYTTIFASGATDVTSGGAANCFVGSAGVASCGHPTIALTGAADVTADGLGVHRVGDMGANYGAYIAISGALDVTSD
jgi:hypothetical protein